jgi:predicted metalloprotease with PDZ domain
LEFRPLRKLALLALTAAAALPASAQQRESRPQPVIFSQPLPQPQDIAYPGTLTIDVDARDTARAIFRVKQTIPVRGAGRMTLLYPEWLPGNHAPRGPISSIAGLRISAGGRAIPWTRDPGYVHAFHVDVPQGARELDVQFEHLSPTEANQGRIVMTPDMLNIQWEKLSLYPAGYFTRNIPIQASVTLPAGFQAATSLDVASRRAERISYRAVSYETLVDSPMFAGRYYRREKLSPDVNLNLFADRPEDLAATPEQIAAHRRLVEQTIKLTGAKHYDEYEFLVALTDELGDIGLEHLRSSENGHARTYFTDWAKGSAGRDLLAHEYIHSWNGKYRRGAGSWQPTYQTPIDNSLLWVYEGQTQFWGNILSARSGMMPREDVLGELARNAASLDISPGRAWRPLIDTTLDPIVGARRPKPFPSYHRGEDYYGEGMLIWLDVDSIIRERTRGARSIDDFARAFFGVNPGEGGINPYTLDDVVRTLNAITPYDWAGYLNRYVNQPGKAPLDWVRRGGYQLVYRETPTPYFTSREKARDVAADLTYSLGITLGKDGDITGVAWDSPLFDEGVTSGTRILAVNGRAYSADDLKGAITAAKTAKRPIQLQLKKGNYFRTVSLPYYGGLRYPVLEKVGRGPSTLDALLAPL